MFYRHICYYTVQLLNDWSIPIVTICCFSQFDCNNPLIITHCCSNDSISIIKSINLVNTIDLYHCTEWSVLPSIRKQIYYLMGGGSFWTGLWVMFLCWHFSESDPDKIWSLGAVTLWLFFREFQRIVRCHHPKQSGKLVQWHCGCLFFKSQTTKHHKTSTKYGPLVHWHWIVSGSFKQMIIVINRNI